jgi:L-fucose isomerase
MIKNPHQNRLIGALPKIGIRPTIDGRRQGVRESLEDQTMQIAKSTADFLSQNLQHSNGSPVECVIADTCIGGVAEAAQTAEKFVRTGVGVSITVTPAWCYGSETMDMDPIIPKAVWGVNGTERPGAVYLAAVMAAHAQKGLPAHSIYGRDVQDSDDTSIPQDVQEKLLRFTKAGLAATTMRGKSYLAMGGISMGIVGSIVNQAFFEDYLGMRVETVDMTEFVRRIECGIFDPEEYAKAYDWVRSNCSEGADFNPPGIQHTRTQKDEDWAFSIKMALIARDLMIGNPQLDNLGFGEEALGHNAIVGGFQGQRQWTDHFPNGDFMEAILASSFDWNGSREPIIVATENDSLNGVSMLLGHLLTGRAQIFADVRTYWSPDAVKRVSGYHLSGRAAGGFLHLINSGPAALDGTGEQLEDGDPVIKPWWEVTPADAERCLKATTWHAGTLEYFRGGGWSTRYRTRGSMPLTMCRINLIKGLGPTLQITEGYSVELPDEVHDILDERTNPTWPTTWFAPRIDGSGPFRDVYSVMNHWGANHGALSYGHIGADLITLASILRIPVALHNVPEEKIFRPHVWGAFGAMDLQGSDFRACEYFGPKYG